MKIFMRSTLALVTGLVLGLGASGPAVAAPSAPHVVDADQVQARLDQRVNREAADREAVQLVLARPDIRVLAERAGLNLQRASEAVAVLSGPELDALARQAADINADVGGSGNVVISTTAIIIILLIIILVAN